MENKQEIGKVFDEMQDGYTDKIKRWVPYYEELISKGYQSLPRDFKPSNILDLGCGNGNATNVYLPHLPESDYLLVDASSEMISECQQRFQEKENIRFEEAYFQNLELPPNEFDLIVATLSLHHLNEQEKEIFFPKLYASLTNQGILIIADLFVNKDDEDHKSHLLKWEEYAISHYTTQDEWNFIMDHYVKYDFPNNFQTYKVMLEKAGFSEAAMVWNHEHWGVISAKK